MYEIVTNSEMNEATIANLQPSSQRLRFTWGVVALLLTSASPAGTVDEAQAAFARGEYKAAADLLRPLANSGDAAALAELGDLYAIGQGVQLDIVRAGQYWRMAAEKGIPKAMSSLAALYQSGNGGLPKDETLAVAWTTKAAENLFVPSMLNLTARYANGIGVDKDLARAIAWATLATEYAGEPRIKTVAKRELQRLSTTANPTDIERARETTDSIRASIGTHATPTTR